jgi:gamma-glutamylcyclotransferase (GGCT)/AIG2-like uncharacterized protein YtfP
MNPSKLNKFFVYGTLRPDVTAPWSDIVHKNPKFKLKYFKAHLPYSKLYMHKTIGYPMAIYDLEKFSESNHTIGFILETDNPDETLEVFDYIECYPTEYDRYEVNCFNEEMMIFENVYFYSKKKELLNENDLEDLGIYDFALYEKN